MISIRQNLCPSIRYSIKCPYTRTPTRIVIHNTANDAPASNEVSYMINRPDMVSFHYAVDDKEAVQGLPLDRGAFASGDGGRGTGNLYGIHIEICYSLSGGQRFTKSEQNAAELTAQLLKKYGWGIDKVTKHQDYDGKYCPHRTLDLGWKRFLNLVQNKLNELESLEKKETENSKNMEDDDMTKERFAELMAEYRKDLQDNDCGNWSAEARKWAIASGLFAGSTPFPDGTPNYMWGDSLTREQAAQLFYSFAKMMGKA